MQHLEFENKRTIFPVYKGKGDRDRHTLISTTLLGELKDFLGERKAGFLFINPKKGKLSTRTI